MTETLPYSELTCAEVWGGNGPIRRRVRLPGLDGMVLSKPCGGGRGGDVYFVSACSAGLFARVYLADVAGHGETVAELSGWLHRALRARLNQHDSARIFRDVNRRILRRGFQALSTAACFTYDARAGELNYCYAGHPPILHFRSRDQQWAPLRLQEPADRRLRNVVFGVAEDAEYDVCQGRLEPGDLLLLYSDGLTETPNPDRVLFGEERLIECLRNGVRRELPALVDDVMESLHAFAGRTNFDHDDITIIAFRAQEPVRGPLVWHLVRNRWRKWSKRRRRARAQT
jgi:sigma-B regulation protein RsbU (phosphoserine phosphatase)